METIVICPDIHCRDFYKPVLDIRNKPVIFLGDYLDPYNWEGFSFENGLANLEEIIEFKKKFPNQVTLLFGNHDFNYMWGFNWASRFNKKYAADAFWLFEKNFDLFEPYKLIGDVLFTHAGISNAWVKDNSIQDCVEFINKEWEIVKKHPFEESKSALFDCGYIRGGLELYGGIFWNDLREIDKVNPVNHVQIFGHTQLLNTGSIFKCNVSEKPMYCCDSRSMFVYENENLKRYEN